MNHVRTCVSSIAMMLALAAPLLAQEAGDGSEIIWSVIGGGGVMSSSSDDGDTLSGTLAQTAIDSITVDEQNYGKLATSLPRERMTVSLGFWLPRRSVTSEPEMPHKSEALAVALRALPNPFREQTTISYQLPANAMVRLQLFDAAGRNVRLLLEGRQSAGAHDVIWNGNDQYGEPVPSGTYIYQLELIGDSDARHASGVVAHVE